MKIDSKYFAMVWKPVLFIALLVLLDFSFVIFRYHSKNVFAAIGQEKMDKAYREYFLSNRSADMLFVGSSHGQFGIDPQTISNCTGYSAYNYCFGAGGALGCQYQLISALLDRPKIPKVIVFEIGVFAPNTPPYAARSYIKDILARKASSNYSLKDYAEQAKHSLMLMSNAYRYGRNIPQYVDDILSGTLMPPDFRFKETVDLHYFSQYQGYEITPEGWVKGRGILNKKFVRYADLVFQPRDDAVKALSDTVELCRRKNVQLIFVQLPENGICLKYDKKYKAFEQFMDKFCKERDLHYWSFNSVDGFPVNDDSLFFDSDHLNEKGGEAFTQLLSTKLISLLRIGAKGEKS